MDLKMQKAATIKTIFQSPIASYSNIEENQEGDDEQEIQTQFPEENSPSPAIHEQQTNDYTIPLLEAIACAIIMEETADEFAIIGRIGGLPNVQANLEYKTLADRFDNIYGGGGGVHVFDPETIEPYEIALHKQKFVKFQKDRSYMETIFRGTINELTSYGTYKFLVHQLSQDDRKFYEENQLLDKELENRVKLNDLQKLLEYERRKSLQEIQASSELIGNLKDQFEDLTRENKIKTNYIESWENSRMEQNILTLDKHEEFYINVINGAKIEIERETRIDAEIENFIRQNQKQYEEDIQMWMERYDREIEVRDTQMQILKTRREEQFSKLEDVSILYETHRREIQEYLEVKEQRRQAAELVEKRHKVATKIQAWWRGLMVRKGFGQFRKKGKKDKNSGKKKGKK